MFAVLKSFSMLKYIYNFEMKEVITNNGVKFGSGKFAKNKENYSFERLLAEMETKHRHTRY